MLSILCTELSLNLLEVQRLETGTGPAVDSGLVPDDLASQRFREAANGLTEVALEEFDDGRREVKLLSTVENILLGELVGSHPLCEVTDNLGGRGNLDDVSTLSTRRISTSIG